MGNLLQQGNVKRKSKVKMQNKGRWILTTNYSKGLTFANRRIIIMDKNYSNHLGGIIKQPRIPTGAWLKKNKQISYENEETALLPIINYATGFLDF